MINRDKIVRFGEKFEKKIFATTFFRTEICPCLSLLIFSRWLFFSQSAWHYMCHVTCDPVSTNEIADATRGAQTHCAVEPPYWFPSERPDGGFVAYLPILCFFTLYFGLIVVVKPKKTLSGLHWLSFSFERSRISTGEVSSWGRMNHLSCRHSHYLPRAAGGWIGFTEDIHGLWLRLDLKEMFLKMTFKNRKVSFVLMCDNLVHRVNCPSATIWSHYGQYIITFPINHVHQTFFPISLSMRYLQLRTEPVLKSTNDLLRCDNLADWSRLFFFR